MKEIERAIEKAKKDLDFTKRLIMTYETLPDKSEKCLEDMNDEIKHKEFLETTLICLQSELDRQENKVLTLSELKEMVGEPVWNAQEGCWDIIHDIDVSRDEIYFEYGHDVVDGKISGLALYKHKPNGGE